MIKFIKKLILREKYDSESYINFLKSKGIKIGEFCKIYSPTKTEIDVQNPHMLKIGNNVKISTGVKILTHDFSWSVTSGIDGYITGSVGKVEIGNNVFIGMNAIITRNVTIGDNVVIGTGSVVTHDCESGYIYAGVPARKIMTIEEYHSKRKNNQIEDAKRVALNFFNNTGKKPTKAVLREFIFLFEHRENYNDEVVNKVLRDSDHYEKCLDEFKNTKPEFDGLDDFLEYCGIKGE